MTETLLGRTWQQHNLNVRKVLKNVYQLRPILIGTSFKSLSPLIRY